MENMVKLSALLEREKATICEVKVKDEKLKCRLMELGFVKGQKVQVVKNKKRDKTMLVAVRGALISVDYFIAENIFVK